jgi:exodeoxyribonuclease VII large subunit
VQRLTDDGAGPLPVLRSVGEVGPGDRVRIRVADGAVAATVGDAPAKRNGARTKKKASTP